MATQKLYAEYAKRENDLRGITEKNASWLNWGNVNGQLKFWNEQGGGETTVTMGTGSTTVTYTGTIRQRYAVLVDPRNTLSNEERGRQAFERFAQDAWNGTGWFEEVGASPLKNKEGALHPDYAFYWTDKQGNGRLYPKNEEGYGQFGGEHWDQYGKTKDEGRILPTKAIFSVSSDGKLSVNTGYVSEGYKKNFEDFAKNINNSGYAGYKETIEGIKNSFRDENNTTANDVNFILNNFVGTTDVNGNPDGLIDAAYVSNSIPDEARWNIETDGSKAPLMNPEASYFNPNYYITTGYGKKAAADYLNKSTFRLPNGRSSNDLDITYKYGIGEKINVDGNEIPAAYLSKFFTEASKDPDFDPLEHRVTEEQDAIAATKYVETITDAQKEMLRSYGLGLGGAAFDPLTQTYKEYIDTLEFAIDPGDTTSAFFETDEEGNIIYETDEEGNQILDEEGNPIPIPKIAYDIEYKKDEDGNIVYEIKKDEEGNFVYDAEGNFVYTDQPQIASQTPKLNQTFSNNPMASAFGSSVFNVYGAKDLALQDQFQQIALDAFKTSYDKLKAVKKEENELSMLKGLPGYDEIYSANESIANSILGDSGIGGYLSILGYNPQEVEENLTDQLSGFTGISNNSVIFNWEKWFEEEFTQRYNDLNTIESDARANLEGLDPEKALDEEKFETFKQEVTDIERFNAQGLISNEWKTLMKNYNFNTTLSKEEVLKQANPTSWAALMERYGLETNTTKEEAEAAFSENIDVLDDEGNPTGEIKNKYNLIYELEDNFKTSFIEDYLEPRFNQSKSMNEFISYLDSLDPDEQNILQTETGLTAITDVAEKYAKKRLRAINNAEDKTFDYEFYMNPLKNDNTGWSETDAKYKDYVLQAQKVSDDWKKAKDTNGAAVIENTESAAYPNGITWNDYAYYYGLDLNDAAQFARLHYDAVGQNYAFDGARDAFTYKDISDYANEKLIPILEQEKIALDGNVFSEFTTPDELADALLSGINPDENDPAWKELLEIYDIDDYTMELEAVRELIVETLSSSDAKAFREGIKYLNEKGQTPTQKKLGVSYIQRESDKKELEDPDNDVLFNVFKEYGYEGTADDFYNDFMPDDTDRGEMSFLTDALSGDLDLKELSSDPFEALADLNAFLGEGGDNIFDSAIEKDEKEKEDYGNYFDLFGNDNNEEDDEYISDMDYSMFFK